MTDTSSLLFWKLTKNIKVTTVHFAEVSERSLRSQRPSEGLCKSMVEKISDKMLYCDMIEYWLKTLNMSQLLTHVENWLQSVKLKSQKDVQINNLYNLNYATVTYCVPNCANSTNTHPIYYKYKSTYSDDGQSTTKIASNFFIQESRR